MKKTSLRLLALLLLLTVLFTACDLPGSAGTTTTAYTGGSFVPSMAVPFTVADVPVYSGKAYAVINNHVPFFADPRYGGDTAGARNPFEYFSDLDDLGRCGTVYANVCLELMPTEERGEIGSVKPTGWHTVKYDCVEGKYLYNRCHLLGFQLTGENANVKNLITGTRYLNVQGMLPFEDMVADYVRETGNHVLYRVTPVFYGEDLVAQGVLMEAKSVEDAGEGIQFNVFVYNVQPGVEIDYATGESWLDTSQPAQTTKQDTQADYVLNTNSKKFHYPSCSSVADMNPANRSDYHGTRAALIDQGYDPCGRCKP